MECFVFPYILAGHLKAHRVLHTMPNNINDCMAWRKSFLSLVLKMWRSIDLCFSLEVFSTIDALDKNVAFDFGQNNKL